jgi:hypothetical protein
MAQAKLEMIQEPFLAKQGDPRRFTSLGANPAVHLQPESFDNDQRDHEKRREVGLLK